MNTDKQKEVERQKILKLLDGFLYGVMTIQTSDGELVIKKEGGQVVHVIVQHSFKL